MNGGPNSCNYAICMPGKFRLVFIIPSSALFFITLVASNPNTLLARLNRYLTLLPLSRVIEASILYTYIIHAYIVRRPFPPRMRVVVVASVSLFQSSKRSAS